ncbi:MAG: hypothetical protein J5585_03780 [Clostridia bacterium]|nr:hypothetical protein [Clostridia bacterium]
MKKMVLFFIIILPILCIILTSCMINDAAVMVIETTEETENTDNMNDYDEAFFNEIYNDIFERLNSGVVEAGAPKSFNECYDCLPGIEILSFANNVEKKQAEETLGAPLIKFGSGHEFTFWQYRTNNNNTVPLRAEYVFDGSYTFDELTLVNLKICVINEVIDKDNVDEESKKSYEEQLAELTEKRRVLTNKNYEKIVSLVECFCGHELPKIYKEEYITKLSNTCRKAIEDYYSSK